MFKKITATLLTSVVVGVLVKLILKHRLETI